MKVDFKTLKQQYGMDIRLFKIWEPLAEHLNNFGTPKFVDCFTI